MTSFEIGKTYRQTFANGEAVQFTPTKRHKNGNWYGLAIDVTLGGRFGKPRYVTVFNPPVSGWRESNSPDVAQ